MHLVQCAANFSEGQHLEVVEAIVEAMSSVPGATVIDYSLDPDHNRAVVTVLGTPARVVESAFEGARKAVELIDLRTHRGEHPRIGAADVIPFVPLGKTAMEECVEASKELAERIGNELRVPVFLYEHSASQSHRKALPDIRRGGFEFLAGRELVGDLAPDFGPFEVHPTAGACVVGARGPLIAFNVVLNTDNIHIARKIANALRESTGGLKGVRALGIPLKSRSLVQISMNITQPDLVPLHRIVELIRSEAGEYGVSVIESEVIGALPLKSVLDAARHSLQLPGLKENQILDLWYDR